MILGEDNQKMSKSRGNVINPDDIIRDYGADSMRVYEMFMGPLEVSKPWITAGLVGVSRFLERLWAIGKKPLVKGSAAVRGDPAKTEELTRLLHRTIKKVGADTASLNFNTAISQMMIYSNELAKLAELPEGFWEPLVIMAGAYAPHLGEELWEKLGHGESVSRRPWPQYDERFIAESDVTVVVQVNGKIRDRFGAPAGTAREALEKTALELPGVLTWTAGLSVVRVITVPDRLVNIVVKER
jgi:leucyl-tRNA synthetase